MNEELQLKFEILPCEYGVIVLFYVRCHAFRFSCRNCRKVFGYGRYSCLNLLRLLLLFLEVDQHTPYMKSGTYGKRTLNIGKLDGHLV